VFLSVQKDFGANIQHANAGFKVGQEGEFLLYDSFHNPIETVRGKIVKLMDGKDSLYAILETEQGMRPARLCRSAIRQSEH
jgi:hypothetical protein